MFVCLGIVLKLHRNRNRSCCRHCSDARYVWNLCVEQENGSGGRAEGRCPGSPERCRQLTEARAASPWLAGGSVTVQQQAIRDLTSRPWRTSLPRHSDLATSPGARPGRTKASASSRCKPRATCGAFNRNNAAGEGPEGRDGCGSAGPAPYRRARSLPGDPDRAGRWHIAFAVDPRAGPGARTGQAVGIDRGVKSAALSTGEMLRYPGLTVGETAAPAPR